MLVQDEKRSSLHLRFELCTYGIPGSRDFSTFLKAEAEESGSNIYIQFSLWYSEVPSIQQ